MVRDTRRDGPGILLLSAGLALLGRSAGAQLAPDDIVVSDAGFGAAALFLVDRTSGNRTVLSGCADDACTALVGGGPGFEGPAEIAFEAGGLPVVVDQTLASLLRVDPITGDRSDVSGCDAPGCGAPVGAGPAFGEPIGAVVLADGTLLVSDRVAVNMSPSRILAVDPTNGDRTVVSGCPDFACAAPVGAGPALSFVDGLALEPSGDVLVTQGASADVLRVDPTTGNRASAAAGTGPFFGQPRGLAPLPDDSFLVVSGSDETLYRVTATGDRAVFSGCLDGPCSTLRGSGPVFGFPFGVARAFDGSLLVTDSFPSALLEVGRTLGDRFVLSGCADPACTGVVGAGESFRQASRVAVVPTPQATVFDFESDIPGGIPGGVVGTGGNVTVAEAGGFTGFAAPAAAGSQLAYLSSGPASNGVGPSGADVTGDGSEEQDVASLFLFFERTAADPPDLAFDYDVVTGETTVEDPFAVWLDGSLVASGAVGSDNGSFPGVAGFSGVPATGPDGSSFDQGRLGYRTVRIDDVPVGFHVLHFFVADAFDDGVDTGMLVDGVRFVPEPGRLGMLLAGIAALLVTRARRSAAVGAPGAAPSP